MGRTSAATTAERRFPLVGEMTGAFSIGAWVKRASDTTWDTIYARCTSGNVTRVALEIAENDKVVLEITGNLDRESTATVLAADGWVFIGIDKAAGTATPRVHIWKQASGWTHQKLSGTQGNPSTAGASSTVRIGEYTGGTNDNFNGDIETVVEYNGTQLTDAQWEAIAFGRSGLLSKKPTGLWELRQAEVAQKVPDLSGTGMNESVRAGTSVATRSCPFYFAGSPPLVTRQAASGGEQHSGSASVSATGTVTAVGSKSASTWAGVTGAASAVAKGAGARSGSAQVSCAGGVSGTGAKSAAGLAIGSGAGSAGPTAREPRGAGPTRTGVRRREAQRCRTKCHGCCVRRRRRVEGSIVLGERLGCGSLLVLGERRAGRKLLRLRPGFGILERDKGGCWIRRGIRVRFGHGNRQPYRPGRRRGLGHRPGFGRRLQGRQGPGSDNGYRHRSRNRLQAGAGIRCSLRRW